MAKAFIKIFSSITCQWCSSILYIGLTGQSLLEMDTNCDNRGSSQFVVFDITWTMNWFKPLWVHEPVGFMEFIPSKWILTVDAVWDWSTSSKFDTSRMFPLNGFCKWALCKRRVQAVNLWLPNEFTACTPLPCSPHLAKPILRQFLEVGEGTSRTTEMACTFFRLKWMQDISMVSFIPPSVSHNDTYFLDPFQCGFAIYIRINRHRPDIKMAIFPNQ